MSYIRTIITKKENANAIWIYNGIFILILSIGLWLQKHKPKNKNSFTEMYRLRMEARLIAEEVVLHDVVNCFH